MRRNTCVKERIARILTVVLLAVAVYAPRAGGENWPRFRGPNGQGLSEATTIPATWSEQDYDWQITLPGIGHSSPVVWADRVFVTCADRKRMRGMLLCLDATTGNELWRRAWDLTKYRLNSLNSYASSTPALDGEQVYVLWSGSDETTLAALTHNGQEVWSTTLSGVHARHGKGTSPAVYGDYVIVQHEQEKNNEGTGTQWLGIDRRTGAIAWRIDMPAVASASYSTPCRYGTDADQECLVFASNVRGITGVDLQTGAVRWEVASALPERVVGSPVMAGDLLIGTCGEGGRGTRLAAVRPAQNGSTWTATEVYSLEGRIVPYVPTPVAYEGLLFLFHDSGLVSCLKADTGQTLWSEKPAGRFYGSPVCVAGRLYCITRDGDVVVLDAGPRYNLLGVSPLGEESHATPAVAAGRMYLRTLSHLIAIGDGGR